MPDTTIAVQDFKQLPDPLEAPFRGSFAGFVHNVQQSQSLQGEDKLDFRLVDCNGMWLSCCAMGINAKYEDIDEGPCINIVEGHYIIGYFGTGRSKIGEDPAKIMFFQTDSTVILVRTQSIVPLPQQQIPIL